MYKFIDNNEISVEQWWKYTDNNPLASVFHTPYMNDAFRGVPKLIPFAYFVVDTNDKIVGMMNGFIQRFVPLLPGFVSKRSVLMHSPLFDNESVLDYMLHEYRKRVSNHVLFTELRANYDMAEYNSVLAKHGFRYEDHLNILVDLSQSEDTLWLQVHSKRRNEIRKALKCGVRVEQIGIDHLEEAFSVLKEVYDRAKLPLFDIQYFKNCLDSSTHNCRLVIYCAFYDDVVIGTMFTLQYKRVVYDFFAGSFVAYYHLNPNDLIPWEVFIDSKKNGYHQFDFGGAGKPNIPYGVRDYKKKFGGTLVNHGRYIQASIVVFDRLFRFMKSRIKR